MLRRLAIALLAAGLGAGAARAENAARPVVIATLFPVVDFAREIAGDAAAYFPVGDASRLAGLIRQGVEHGFRAPGKDAIKTKTWRQVSTELSGLLLA